MAETELDRTKQYAAGIRETIEVSTMEERETMLDDLYEKWIVKINYQNDIFDYLKLAISNFNLTVEGLQIGLFDRACKVVMFQLMYLEMYMKTDDEEKKSQYQEKFSKLFRAVIDAGNSITSSLYLMSSMTLEDIGQQESRKIDMFRYSELDYEKLLPQQILILYITEQLHRKQYKRYIKGDKGMCYQKIYSEKGFDTHAWKPATTIKNFVIEMCSLDTNATMWELSTMAKDNIKFVSNHMGECFAKEFEDLVKDRHIFSFRNGIYITKNENNDENDERVWVDKWIPFEGPNAKKIGASIVSSKFFDLEFIDCSHYEDWFDVVKKHCPNFMNVMNYQQWDEDVQRWLCILMGRMLYNVGELDDWQVFIFLLGTAGSGKSTIIENIIKQLYEPADVGTVSNNMEKIFGLSGLVDKFIIVGPEIKGNWSIDQASLQSMVTGESISLSEKYKTPVSIKFPTPIAIAGNVIPNFEDNSGSMSRRTIIFPFDFKVKKGDTKLGHKIQGELSFIIQACNKGYLHAYHKYGSAGIWEVLPDLFKATQENMTENTNALTNFLKSDLVVFGKDKYCKEKVFITAFNNHCKESHFRTMKWTHQFYSSPFAEFGLKMERNGRKKYPNKQGGKFCSGTFITGLDIKEMTEDMDEDDDDDKSSTNGNLFD